MISDNILSSHLAGGTWYRLTEEHVSGEYCKRNSNVHMICTTFDLQCIVYSTLAKEIEELYDMHTF